MGEQPMNSVLQYMQNGGHYSSEIKWFENDLKKKIFKAYLKKLILLPYFVLAPMLFH